MSHQIRQIETGTVTFAAAENGIIPQVKLASFSSTYSRPPIVVVSIVPTGVQDVNAFVKNISTTGFAVHTSDQYLGVVNYVAYETE